MPEVSSQFWDYDLAFEKDKRDNPDLYRMVEEGTLSGQEGVVSSDETDYPWGGKSQGSAAAKTR
ncbi:MAG: hypothetical protein FWF36_02450 [Propionibacteriaceae bacterium]|nr:hypothetical protein [Propionibacteriaceae bacterium]